MQTTRLKIAKWDGSTDVAHLEKALEAVERVQSVRIDSGAHEAVVQHENAPVEQLTAAVKSLGYLSTVE